MYSIIFISVSARRGIAMLNDGEEQVVVCAPIVYLSAHLSADLEGAPTEWVQLTGSPIVEIINVNETDSYYVTDPLNIGSDKIFRFYIHRNTQLEKYGDITIRTTPVDYLSPMAHGIAYSVDTTQTPNDLLLIDTPTIDADFVFDTSIRFNAEGKCFTDTVFINIPLPRLFTETTDPLYDIHKRDYHSVIVEEWNGTSWVLAYTFNRNDTRILDYTNSSTRIRYGIRYNRPGVGLVTYYTGYYDYDVSDSFVIAGKEVLSSINHGVLANSQSVTRLIYTLVPIAGEDNLLPDNHGVLSNTTAINRIVYVLVPINGQDNLISAAHGVLNTSFTITRTSGTSIGG